MEVNREMAKTSHVKEEGDRINRFVLAVCGVTTVPDDFDPGDVVNGERGAYYPGLHPEIRSTYHTTLKKECRGCSPPTQGTPSTFKTLKN